LHDGLIIATNREEVSVIAVEGNSHDMLRVASKGNGPVSLSARVSENVDQAIVISGYYKGLIL
jgi:hypothetical protein